MIVSHRLRNSLPATLSPEDAPCCKRCESQLIAAKRELGAFLMAVCALFGKAKAVRAADHWIALAESMEAPLVGGYPNRRDITFAAASQLARECFSIQKLT